MHKAAAAPPAPIAPKSAEAIADMITKAEAAVDKDAKDLSKALLEVWKGQYTARAGSEPDAAQIMRATEAFSAHVALEAREEIAIEKAQVAVGEVVGGLMLPAEKKAIDAMLVEAEREGGNKHNMCQKEICLTPACG